MTVDEIKETTSMRDILALYGLHPNRAGMIRCPFHAGDREPSLKVYEKDYHCFGCGAHGDIFDFVQRMDGLTFREAFENLGGRYEKTVAASLKIYHARKRRDMERKRAEAEERARRLNCMLITVYRRWLDRLTPFSDAWCGCQNELARQIGIFEDGLR